MATIEVVKVDPWVWRATVTDTEIFGAGTTPAGSLMDLMVKNFETLNEALGGENIVVPDEEEEPDED